MFLLPLPPWWWRLPRRLVVSAVGAARLVLALVRRRPLRSAPPQGHRKGSAEVGVVGIVEATALPINVAIVDVAVVVVVVVVEVVVKVVVVVGIHVSALGLSAALALLVRTAGAAAAAADDRRGDHRCAFAASVLRCPHQRYRCAFVASVCP